MKTIEYIWQSLDIKPNIQIVTARTTKVSRSTVILHHELRLLFLVVIKQTKSTTFFSYKLFLPKYVKVNYQVIYLSFSRKENFTDLHNFTDNKIDFLLLFLSRNTCNKITVLIPHNFHIKIW